MNVGLTKRFKATRVEAVNLGLKKETEGKKVEAELRGGISNQSFYWQAVKRTTR